MDVEKNEKGQVEDFPESEAPLTSPIKEERRSEHIGEGEDVKQ